MMVPTWLVWSAKPPECLEEVCTASMLDAGRAWGHEVWFDSLTMFVFFLLSGRWLELRMRDRTAGALSGGNAITLCKHIKRC